MVGAGLILEDVVIELIKWVFVEAVPSASIAIIAASCLVIVLPAFVFVSKDLVGSNLRQKRYCFAYTKRAWALGSGFLSGWYFWAITR